MNDINHEEHMQICNQVMASPADSFSQFPGDVIPQLMCSCCLEEFKEPKDLQCGHTFCKECLEDYTKSNPNKRKVPENGQKGSGHIAIIKCPECRQESPKPENLKDLKTNYALRNVLEKVEQERQKQKSIPVCFEHGENQLFYCVTCKKTICRACTVLDHPKPSHEWTKLIDVYEEQRASLGDILKDVKEISKKFLFFIRDSKTILLDVQQVAEKAEKDICNHFEELSINLQASRDNLLEEVHKIRASRIQKLEKDQAAASQIITQISDERQLIKEAEEQAYLHDYVRRFATMKASLSDFCNAVPPHVSEDFALLQYLPKKHVNISLGYIAVAHKVELEFSSEFGMGLMWGLGEVGSIASSPDGLIAVTETASRRVSVWELQQGQYNLKFYMGSHLVTLLQTLFTAHVGSFLEQPFGCPTGIAVTSDGKFVVADGIHGARLFSKSGVLERFSNDVPTKSSPPVECIATDRQGRVYISGSSLIGVYERIPSEDLYRKMYLKTLVVESKPQKLSTDGKLLVIMVQETEDDDIIRLKTLMEKQQVLFVPLDESLCEPGTSPEGTNKVIIVYDLDIWEVLIVFEVTPDASNICYDKATGSLFVTTDLGCIDQYSINTGKFMAHLKMGLDKPKGLALVGSNMLAVANNTTVKLFHIKYQ